MFTKHLPKKYTPVILIALALLTLLVASIVAGLDSKMDFLWGNGGVNFNSITEPPENIAPLVALRANDLPIAREGWRLYQHPKFSVEIPDGWTVLEVPVHSRVQFYSDGVLRDINDEWAIMDEGAMTIFYNLSKEIKDNWYESQSESKAQISIDGYPGTKYLNVKGGPEAESPAVFYEINMINADKANYYVDFVLRRYSSQKHAWTIIANKDIISQIFSSFKIIK